MKREDLERLPQHAQEYLQTLERRGHSEHTILEYASDLRLFFYFLLRARNLLPEEKISNEEGSMDELDCFELVDPPFLREITAAESAGFISYCRNTRGNQANTLSRRFISVKRFLRYLTLQKHLLDRNPMDELDPQKTGKSLPIYLPLPECELLLDTVAQDGENPHRDRDYCMLILFLNCGLRLSELCGLNLKDLHSDDTGRVRGKGNKQRTIYFNEACLNALRRYLAVRPQEGLTGTDRNALFISRNKRRISQRSVERMLEKYLNRCGLDGKGYSIHKLRHTAATLMYQNDVDVLALKELLGHENLSTTQIYTHVLSEQLRAAVDRNPLHRR